MRGTRFCASTRRSSARGWACARAGGCITAAQTGAAPLVPLTSCMGAPLALPTHTPTV
jgi:hypothetical protein